MIPQQQQPERAPLGYEPPEHISDMARALLMVGKPDEAADLLCMQEAYDNTLGYYQRLLAQADFPRMGWDSEGNYINQDGTFRV